MVGVSVSSILRVYVFITFSAPVFSSSVFLRELPLPDLADHAAEEQGGREPRSVPEWRAEVRRQALMFGQSEDEINRVQFYLKKMKEIAAVKFPSAPYSEKTGGEDGKDVSHTQVCA